MSKKSRSIQASKGKIIIKGRKFKSEYKHVKLADWIEKDNKNGKD